LLLYRVLTSAMHSG